MNQGELTLAISKRFFLTKTESREIPWVNVTICVL